MTPPQPPVSLDRGVLGELVAIPERDDHPARLEEGDAVLGVGRALSAPAQALVELACSLLVLDAERDEAEALVHLLAGDGEAHLPWSKRSIELVPIAVAGVRHPARSGVASGSAINRPASPSIVAVV